MVFEITKVACGLLRPPSVVFFLALSCVHPSCVEVIMEEFWFVGIPLSVEVIEIVIGVCGYPSYEEVIFGVLALCLSL